MSFNVLIIDDDVSFKKILEVRLRSFIPGMVVQSFGRLSDARNFLSHTDISSYQLVVLDQHLPDGRGLELLHEGWFRGLSVLAVSSDDAPEIPGATVQAGAAYFLNKVHISQPLFKPLVQGIIDRNNLQQELNRAKIDKAVIDSVKTLVATLRHEINNPLGAVLGAAYLLNNDSTATEDQKEAARLVESSGKRIKHVLDELCQAVALDSVKKANHQVYHIPGDEPWETSEPEEGD